MLKKSKIIVCVLLACNVLFAGKIIVHRGRTRARIKSGIPNHNYAAKNRSRSVTAISKRGIVQGEIVNQTQRQLDRIAALAPEIKSRASSFKAFGQPVFELTGRDNIPGLTERLLSLQDKDNRALLVEEMKAQQSLLDTGTLHGYAKELVEKRVTEISTTLAKQTPADEPTANGSSPSSGDADAEVEPKVKLYQLSQPALVIDHCSVSQFALQISETGDWSLSLKADQNRTRNSYNPTQYIKRNEFEIRVRALGAIQTGFTRLDDGAGRPVLAQWKPIKFFVENGAPYYGRWSASDKESTSEDSKTLVDKKLLAQFFEDTDRVEVEFFYR